MVEQRSFFMKRSLQVANFLIGLALVVFGAASLKNNNLHILPVIAGALFLLWVVWGHFFAVVRFSDEQVEFSILPVVLKYRIQYQSFISLFKAGEKIYLIAEQKGVQKKYFLPTSLLSLQEQQEVVDLIQDKIG